MLQVDNLRFSYASQARQSVHAIKSISFRLREGEFYSLLGPSGCGKSTTLRCIAGLEAPSGGQIRIGKDIVYSSEPRRLIPAERRKIGMVFQSYAIWPHMSVLENVAFPLVHGRTKLSRGEAKKRAVEALDLVRLAHLIDRPAPFLSGGQQQRIALARALALRPSVLLLDEPLSNLDALLREEMRVEIRRLVRRTGVTTLFVTHDQAEALALSDRFAVMLDGDIIQEGTPQEVYAYPKSSFVASFLGNSNLIVGNLRGPCNRTAGASVIETAIGRLTAMRSPSLEISLGEAAVLCRPESILLHPPSKNRKDNCASGRILSRTFLGSTVAFVVDLGGTTVNVQSSHSVAWNEGDEVIAEFPIQQSQIITSDIKV